VQIAEHTIELAGAPVFYRSAQARLTPPLYLHGCPTSSDDWTPLLARTGGIAPDLVGFGRSGKAANLDYTLTGLANFIELLLERLGVGGMSLVAHGLGAAAGLVFAQRHPERVRRLVLVDALPLLEGFRWPRLARAWRSPGLGELVMGVTTRPVLGRMLRRGYGDPHALSRGRIAQVWAQFDVGTQRAILRLHRATGEAQLEQAGAGLERLAMPALVLWGERDPWFPPAFAERYARRLGHAEARQIDGAGHWPWLERPEVGELIAEFVEAA
jgi:pimeloyl-ACP methyl ester carboxylesterase